MEIPTIPSIIVAAIMSISGLAYLVFYTLYWPGLVEFFVGIFLLIIFFAAWMVIATKFGRVTKSASLRTTDFAVIAVFAAIFIIADWASMILPGPLVYVPVTIAFTSSFPQGIILAALLKIVPKPGAAFTYVIGHTILGAIVAGTPNPLWFPFSIISAVALEAYYLTSKRGTLSSLLLLGFSFGIFSYAIGGVLFVFAVWEYYQPLLITFPVAILSGIMMAIASSIGYGIGSRAVKIAL